MQVYETCTMRVIKIAQISFISSVCVAKTYTIWTMKSPSTKWIQHLFENFVRKVVIYLKMQMPHRHMERISFVELETWTRPKGVFYLFAQG